MSTSGDRFNNSISVGLSFSVVVGVPAVIGVPLFAVPPKRWRRPAIGCDPAAPTIAMRRDGRRCRQVLEVRSLGSGGRGLRARAIHDGCGSFAAGPRADGRPMPGRLGRIAVRPEHPYHAFEALLADRIRA